MDYITLKSQDLLNLFGYKVEPILPLTVTVTETEGLGWTDKDSTEGINPIIDSISKITIDDISIIVTRSDSICDSSSSGSGSGSTSGSSSNGGSGSGSANKISTTNSALITRTEGHNHTPEGSTEINSENRINPSSPVCTVRAPSHTVEILHFDFSLNVPHCTASTTATKTKTGENVTETKHNGEDLHLSNTFNSQQDKDSRLTLTASNINIIGLETLDPLNSSLMVNELYVVRTEGDVYGRGITEIRKSMTDDDKTPFETLN